MQAFSKESLLKPVLGQAQNRLVPMAPPFSSSMRFEEEKESKED
jgi:hypothetical protein